MAERLYTVKVLSCERGAEISGRTMQVGRRDSWPREVARAGGVGGGKVAGRLHILPSRNGKKERNDGEDINWDPGGYGKRTRQRRLTGKRDRGQGREFESLFHVVPWPWPGREPWVWIRAWAWARLWVWWNCLGLEPPSTRRWW